MDIIHAIASWAKDTSPNLPNVYWLNGLAGTGKSTIAHSVCEEMEQYQDGRILGATFFSSRQFIETGEQNYIIPPPIAYHLSYHSASFTNFLLKVDWRAINRVDRQMITLLADP
jgi:hypothetical protein